MRRMAVGAAVALLLAVGACGGGDDDDAERDGSTSSTEEPDDGGASSPDGGEDDAGAGDEGDGGADGGTTGGSGSTTGADAGGGTDGSGGLPATITAQDICSRLAADRVAAALGVGAVTAQASESETPQCSYVFEGPNGSTNATVAVLRSEDVDGRQGADAFQHVIDINRQAAQGSELTETAVSAGDQAVVLSGQTLHFGVVQYGERIVTTILRVDAADAADAVALTEATSALVA